MTRYDKSNKTKHFTQQIFNTNIIHIMAKHMWTDLTWKICPERHWNKTVRLRSPVHICLANTVFSINNVFDRRKNTFLLDNIKRMCLSVTVKQLKCSSDSITLKFKPHAVKLQKTHTVLDLFAPLWCCCKSLKISFWLSHNATLLKAPQCQRESIEVIISVRKENTKCHCVWLKVPFILKIDT